MTLKIRTALPSDFEAITRVDMDSHVEAYGPIFGDGYARTLEASVAYWRALLAGERPSGHDVREVLVAERDGELLAYSGIGPSHDSDPAGAGEVYTLYVHSSAWRTGIGGRLLDTALARLRQLGHAEVTLYVLDANTRAQAFYEAKGWRPDGVTQPSRQPPHMHLRYRAPRAP